MNAFYFSVKKLSQTKAHQNRNTRTLNSAEILNVRRQHGLSVDGVVFVVQPPAEAPPPSRLSLPYKVMKSLASDVYRNVEYDVWRETRKGNMSVQDSPELCFMHLKLMSNEIVLLCFIVSTHNFHIK